MLHKLTALKLEIEAAIRWINKTELEITYEQLERLTLRHSELLDTALNPRM